MLGSTGPILFATSNPHKIDEVRAILAPLGVRILGLAEVRLNAGCGPTADTLAEPIEDGATFEANARIKAAYYARAVGMPCLADDSGLEVDALCGRPGVHSARFARDHVGPEHFDAMPRAQRDQANNALLLDMLRDVPAHQRAARFVCAMCLCDTSGGVMAETRGEFPGVIIDEPRGANGFGYDPLLYLPDAGCTSAELSPEAKNARSHRGAAARLMAARLARNPSHA